jgi:hypothetical protein
VEAAFPWEAPAGSLIVENIGTIVLKHDYLGLRLAVTGSQIIC